jgi:carboxymethylenebutenolidase
VVFAEFEKNMKTAGKELTVSMYEADHAFANPSNPNYEKEYADEAYQKSLAFIKMGLK